MMNEPPGARPGRRLRLTRRGRLVLLVATTLAVGAAVLVPVLLMGGESGDKKTSTLVIPEGRRASEVYASVDKALELPMGTTKDAATAARLKLPEAAKGNPEGYLFPATYPINSSTTPAGLLSYMVRTANQKFTGDQITAGSERNGMTIYQSVTIASIVQAEADTPTDMAKVSRVVHNRLALGMPLQMDSTLNYALNRNTLDTTHADTKIDSPYNTYQRKGLPPTPIGNPGEEAMNAALNPSRGEWLYFVTVAEGDTRFTNNYSEHQKNVEEFNQNRANANGSGSGNGDGDG
ncbi:MULTISPECIES: endolytic transglycosylase MltG [unclassified Streptomyces]|uniref:endolytic transglycosylase MltG n=1 Tax=unclassified Streptomyces TaxID=2593676 RepID=UPI000B83C216|nr:MULTISPECIES: endolytic transglycosylase MltG [unclassified Streptomyces]MYZ37579.1 endolytic transglycosylase MltG [Streptomyces sp. SID4917]